MSGRSRSPASFALACLCACGAGATLAPAFDARFSGDDARRARELAPDLVAEAERAREEARTAGDEAARRDHVERANLLLDAAITEAERIEIDRERAGIDADTERAVNERAEDERARHAIEQEIPRAEAARLARAEAERAFREAEPDETKRMSKTERERLHGEAATFLSERADLVLAAAEALGLDAQTRAVAESALTAARQSKADATGRLALARDALEAAERALGAARAARPGPTPEEVASLVADAAERGLAAELLERGFSIRLAGAFRPGSAEVTPAGRRQIDHVATLTRAHPNGPVSIEVPAENASRMAARIASERARRVLTLLNVGERAQIATAAPAAAASSEPEGLVVFTAYATLPPEK